MCNVSTKKKNHKKRVLNVGKNIADFFSKRMKALTKEKKKEKNKSDSDDAIEDLGEKRRSVERKRINKNNIYIFTTRRMKKNRSIGRETRREKESVCVRARE